MTKPIQDKAEVAVEYPDKLYIGTFERSSQFDAHLDETGISLTLSRTGDADVRKSIRMHLHYGLFADILHDLAELAGRFPRDDVVHREAVKAAAQALCHALEDKKIVSENRSDRGEMNNPPAMIPTPEEEVLLLHALE